MIIVTTVDVRNPNTPKKAFVIFVGNVFKNSFMPSYNGEQANADIIDKIKKAVYEIISAPVEQDDD